MPGLADPLVEHRLSPLLDTLAVLGRREEELGSRARLGGRRGRFVVPVRVADDHAVAQPIAVVRVDRRPDVDVAGHIDENRIRLGQTADVGVGGDVVVAAQPAHELRVGIRGEAHNTQAGAARKHEGRTDRGFARRTGEHDGGDIEEVDIGQEVVDHERREEQRPQHHLLRFPTRPVDRIDVGEHIAAVGTRHGAAMLGDVAEPAPVEPARAHDQLGGHREVSVDAATEGKRLDRRLDDLGESPHRHASPSPGRGIGGRGGEEVPVLHGVTEHRVCDVVRCERERLDTQPGTGCRESARRIVDESGSVQVGAIDFELHADPFVGRPGRGRTIDSQYVRR